MGIVVLFAEADTPLGDAVLIKKTLESGRELRAVVGLEHLETPRKQPPRLPNKANRTLDVGRGGNGGVDPAAVDVDQSVDVEALNPPINLCSQMNGVDLCQIPGVLIAGRGTLGRRTRPGRPYQEFR